MTPETVTFPSADGLLVTAENYPVDASRGHLVLCHRSHFNRGEYRETAPSLNEAGFSCLAIDQRSGMKVMGVTNETYARAKQGKLATGYLAAKPDVEAAVDYCYRLNQDQPIVLVGSSYSASLALLVATENADQVRAVVAFSPGEYFKGIDLAEAISALAVPAFVTSAKKEADDVAKLLRNVGPDVVMQYRPKVEGAHGARVLWKRTPGSKGYWQALREFLDQVA